MTHKVPRIVHKLNRQLYLRRQDDADYDRRTQCRAWISKIGKKWCSGGYHKLPKNLHCLPHHNLTQATLDL